MKKLVLLLTLTIVCQNLIAQICTSVKDGLWTSSSTWSCGRVPAAGDDIVIVHAVRVEATYNGSSSQVVIKSGGDLILDGQLSLGTDIPSCNSTLLIESGGKVSADSPGQNERLFLCGKLILTGKTNGNLQGGISIPADGYNGPAGFDRYGPATLPVGLLFFEGTVANASVNLKWATLYEDGFDYFTIERSSDAVTFEALGTVAGSGNSAAIVNYNFNDNMPLAGRAYYRLKATDFDGSVEYHQVIAIVKESAGKVAIHPNPLSGNEFKIIANVQAQANSKLKIYSIVGKEVYQSVLNETQADFTLNKSLDPGLYIVMLESGNLKYQTKLTVK